MKSNYKIEAAIMLLFPIVLVVLGIGYAILKIKGIL